MRRILAFALIMIVAITFAEFNINYKVQSGDTFYELSHNFNIPIPVLMDWNPDVTPSNLKVGQTLKIPLVSGILYKPTKSMTLSTLAKYFFIDPEEITAINPTVGLSIAANKEIFVPVGKVNTSFTQLADFVWPVYGSITSEFGWRLHPIYKKNMYHSGIDIGVPQGTPVFAARGGTVKYAGWKSDYGNLIIIDHGGYQTYYAHLSKINVYVGLRVEKGDFIARSGNTGTSTGPHLHFEVRKNDELQDPVAYLPRTNTYVMRRVLSE